MQDPPPSAKPVDLEKGDARITKSKREPMQIDDTGTKQKPEKKFKTVLPDTWTVGGKK